MAAVRGRTAAFVLVAGIVRALLRRTRVRSLTQGGVGAVLADSAVDKHTATRKLIRI